MESLLTGVCSHCSDIPSKVLIQLVSDTDFEGGWREKEIKVAFPLAKPFFGFRQSRLFGFSGSRNKNLK